MIDFTILTILLITILTISPILKIKKEWAIWICMGVFWIMSGLRADTVGNDTQEYIRIFEIIGNGNYDYDDSRYEKGYLILNQILNFVSHNTSFLFFVCGGFIYYSIGRFIIRYSTMPALSVLLFLTYGFFSFSMTAIRQSIAIGILLFSFDYIINRKLVKFLLLVVCASFFHITSVLFSLAYVAPKLKTNTKTIIIVCCSSLVGYIIFDSLLGEMLSLFTMYEHYSGGKYFGETRLASIFYVAISSIILLFSYVIITRNRKLIPHNGLFSERYLFTEIVIVLIAVALYILSLKLNILDRIAIYYNIFSIILLPNAVKILKTDLRGIVSAIVILCFFVYSSILLLMRPEWNSVFPYKMI